MVCPAAKGASYRPIATRCTFRPAPHRKETSTLSKDPQLIEKVRYMVDRYAGLPKPALVLCVDEKPQIQATSGIAPELPVRRHRVEWHTHDYLRDSPRALFAAQHLRPDRVIGDVRRRASRRALTTLRCPPTGR